MQELRELLKAREYPAFLEKVEQRKTELAEHPHGKVFLALAFF